MSSKRKPSASRPFPINATSTGGDLGEASKIVLLSVTEGDDKPLKYPSIFFKSDLFFLPTIDLLAYVPSSAEVAEANARLVHPGIEILRASLTAEGSTRGSRG